MEVVGDRVDIQALKFHFLLHGFYSRWSTGEWETQDHSGSKAGVGNSFSSKEYFDMYHIIQGPYTIIYLKKYLAVFG